MKVTISIRRLFRVGVGHDALIHQRHVATEAGPVEKNRGPQIPARSTSTRYDLDNPVTSESSMIRQGFAYRIEAT